MLRPTHTSARWCAGAVTGGVRVNEDDDFARHDRLRHGENADVFAAAGFGPASRDRRGKTRMTRSIFTGARGLT